MKASLFLAFFCLAAVAVTAVPNKNIEDEYRTVEDTENGGVVEPLWSCQTGGDWLCDKSCRMQGRNTGHCNSNDVCICS
ncbi:defensin-A-like [Halictus rubicundus]|uniref:defensin-A-like n=1 Tax=Halictus rubicundus TaxID=77578 RepID=UPI004036A923